MALSRVVSEIFNVEKYRDLEIPVKGQSLEHRRQPRRDAGDVSPPIFWLVGTSMGMSPPIFGVAMYRNRASNRQCEKKATLSFKKVIRNGSISHFSGVRTGSSGGSMNRGPELLGPRVVGPQKNFRQDS